MRNCKQHVCVSLFSRANLLCVLGLNLKPSHSFVLNTYHLNGNSTGWPRSLRLKPRQCALAVAYVLLESFDPAHLGAQSEALLLQHPN